MDFNALVIPHRGHGMPRKESKGHLYIPVNTRMIRTADATATGIDCRIFSFINKMQPAR